MSLRHKHEHGRCYDPIGGMFVNLFLGLDVSLCVEQGYREILTLPTGGGVNSLFSGELGDDPHNAERDGSGQVAQQTSAGGRSWEVCLKSKSNP